jgi:hypothetical protein
VQLRSRDYAHTRTTQLPQNCSAACNSCNSGHPEFAHYARTQTTINARRVSLTGEFIPAMSSRLIFRIVPDPPLPLPSRYLPSRYLQIT